MKKFDFPMRSALLIGLTLVLIAFTLGTFGKAVIYPKPMVVTQEKLPTIVNRTKALQVSNVYIVGSGEAADLELLITNQSTKTITAYSLTAGESGLITMSDLAPGQSKKDKMPLSNIVSSNRQNPELIISAVYFADGSGDGDPKYLGYLTDRMLGIKEQTQRTLEILRSSLKKSGVVTYSDLQELERQASLLQFEEDAEIAPYRIGGRAWIKQRFQLDLKRLKQRSQSLSAPELNSEINNLIVSYETTLTKL